MASWPAPWTGLINSPAGYIRDEIAPDQCSVPRQLASVLNVRT